MTDDCSAFDLQLIQQPGEPGCHVVDAVERRPIASSVTWKIRRHDIPLVTREMSRGHHPDAVVHPGAMHEHDALVIGVECATGGPNKDLMAVDLGVQDVSLSEIRAGRGGDLR